MDRVLRKNFERKKFAYQIAAKLGVGVMSVRRRTRKLGLRRFWQWTAEEDAYLRQHYPTTTGHAVGVALSRKPEAVCYRVHALGLRKNSRRT